MEVFILYVVLLALVVYAIRWMRSSRPVGVENPELDVTPALESPIVVYDANRDLLQERWRMAGISAHATRELELPPWYYDEAEEWQVEQLVRYQLPLDVDSLTRGQAGDVMGLFLAPGEDEVEVLRQLGDPVAGLSLTAARHRVAKLLTDPDQRSTWQALPILPVQREFFRFAGEPVPAGLSAAAARLLITERLASSETLARDWARFLQVYDDVNARSEEYQIRQPELARVGQAVDVLRRDQGRTMTQLARNPHLVVDKLLDLDPELEMD
jgi:hypothetical protein